jgi:dihydrofolate reductase
MKLSLIVAASDRGVIGRAGGLPWRLSADLRRFKSLTMGHALILGRKTWDSIGRPLPGRRMIVVSRGEPALPDGVLRAASFEAALEQARRIEGEETFVIGGAAIYEAALALVDRIYLTRVHGNVDGDTRVAALDGGVPSGFELVHGPEALHHPQDSHLADFEVYERRAADGG